MQKIKNVLPIIAVFSVIFFLNGCVTPTGATKATPPAPDKERISYGEIGTRETLQVEATTEDFKELARIVTDKFLTSRVTRGWSEKSERPRVIVGNLVNNTDDESIRMSDIYDIIQNQLIQSGTVRIVDTSATSFDYVFKTQLTSTHQYSKEGKEIYHMTLQTKLFKLDGELVGQWSHEVKKLKGEKPLF